jgi:hypothetical protein
MGRREYGEQAVEAITNLRSVGSSIGADACFHRPIALGHGTKEFRQLVQRSLAIDKVPHPNHASLDQIQSGADGSGCMVKAGQKR